MPVPMTFSYGPDEKGRTFSASVPCDDCTTEVARGSFIDTILCMINCFAAPTAKKEEAAPQGQPPQHVAAPQLPPQHKVR